MKDDKYYFGEMNLYCAGVFDGTVHFKTDELLFRYVDEKSRFLGTPQKPVVKDFMTLPFEAIHQKCPLYTKADWSGDEVILENGELYSKYYEINGQIDGQTQTAVVWAQRKAAPAIDIVTRGGQVIAFMRAYRYGLEIAVVKGLEKLTPLVNYDDASLSAPEYGIDNLGISQAVMRDGIKLAQRVLVPFLPGKEQARWPVIMVRSCYTKERMQYHLSKYVNKGYAVVMQDVRGRGDSEGELDPFAFERDDSADTIDWIIRQPWSNGMVGTWGASYLGHVVVQGATSGHPNLKCVINEVNVGSPFIDTVRRGGGLCSEPLLCWALAQAGGQRPNMFYMSDQVDWEPIIDIRPIKDIAKKVLGEPANDLWEKWTRYDEENEWWQRSNFTRNFHQVKAPMMVISGWYDGDSLGISETWRALTKHDVAGRRIILGPWEHQPNTTRDVEGVAFGNNAVIYTFDINNLRWFDHYLKGTDNGIETEPRATYYVVGENKWHTSAEWTPAESTVMNCYLDSDGHANSVHGDGMLSWTVPERNGCDQYFYNPETPLSNLISREVGHRSPINYKGHELREDMLVYTTDPFDNDLTIAGEISAEFYASSSAKDTDWIFRLLDVDEHGNARKLSENVIRAKFRNGFDTIRLLEADKVEAYTLLMENNAWQVPKGHRLRVHVQSSARNLIFPNSNTGASPFAEDEISVVAKNRIYHGMQYPSHIKLPVLNYNK